MTVKLHYSGIYRDRSRRFWWKRLSLWRLRLGWPNLHRWRYTRHARNRQVLLSLESRDIATIEDYIIRLEASARIGSLAAAGRLTDIAADRVGIARRRMAQEALERLRQHTR